jgi:hypothetical protein
MMYDDQQAPPKERDPLDSVSWSDPEFADLVPQWFMRDIYVFDRAGCLIGFTDSSVERSILSVYVGYRAVSEGRVPLFMVRGTLTRPNADVFRRFAAMCEGLVVDFEKRTVALLEDTLDPETMSGEQQSLCHRQIAAARQRAANAQDRRGQLRRDTEDHENDRKPRNQA